MKRPRPGVGSELLPVALILLGLAGTLALIVATHRKTADARRLAAAAAAPPQIVAPPPPPIPVAPTPRRSPPVPVAAEPDPEPHAPLEDPTKKALSRVAAQLEENRQAARAADRRAWPGRPRVRKPRPGRASGDAAKRWSRLKWTRSNGRPTILRPRPTPWRWIATCWRERDAAKAALAKATAKGGGWAVLPHKNPNGTWQRPVVIECRNGTATLQPNGPTVNLVQMSPMMGARSNPLVGAVARELIRVHRGASPDGQSVVPYIFFIVRPDGIRPYYEARLP